MTQKIPTHLITGFLGTGKTTAILHLLANKPDHERWAILVNEFGEVGIDGALLGGADAHIREVAGGCMCCVAGLPTQVALNQLLARSKADRLLIEPTGLGHPAQIIDMLQGEYYRDILELRAIITLVDPDHLQQARYREHATFQDQIAIADVLVANKADRYGDDDRAGFEHWATTLSPAKQALGWCEQGRLDPAWLELPRHNDFDSSHRHGHQHHADTPPAVTLALAPGERFTRRENQGLEHHACGWLFSPALCFSFDRLFSLFNALPAERMKAVMITDQGVFAFNTAEGVLSVRELDDTFDSRVEMLHPQALDWPALEQHLLQAITQL